MTTVKSILANKLLVSFIGVVLVGLLMVSYLVTEVLDTPLFNRPDEITVRMPSTGGVFEGSLVTFRGVKIGKVSDIRLTRDGVVEATAVITDPRPIPQASVVKVRGLSPVGEQYIDFQPTTDKGPFLHDGDTVTATSRDLPKTLASTVISVNKVLEQIDNKDLHTTLVGIARALNGTGDDIGRLADQGYALLRDIDAHWDTTQRLLRNGGVLLQIGADNGANIRQFAASARAIAAFLKAFDPELRRLLRMGPHQLDELNDVIDTVDEVIPDWVDRTVQVTDIIRVRDPHFRALLQAYSGGITTLAGAFTTPGRRFTGHSIVQDEYRCDYGFERRNPRDTTRHAMYTTGYCSSPPNRVVRGAKNAPGPTG